MVLEHDRSRLWPYLLVALAGFWVGYVFGQLGTGRNDWPEQPPHPRSLNP